MEKDFRIRLLQVKSQQEKCHIPLNCGVVHAAERMALTESILGKAFLCLSDPQRNLCTN